MSAIHGPAPFQKRVNYAAACILAGRRRSRGYARCFQEGDDEYVVEALLRRAQVNAALAERLYQFVDRDFAAAAHEKLKSLTRPALARAARRHIEQMQRERKAFFAEHCERFVTEAAWGSWHQAVPEGMVVVKAMRRCDRRTRYFLVPEQDYAQRGQYGMVINEGFHMECAPIT